jgi:polyferredoxin
LVSYRNWSATSAALLRGIRRRGAFLAKADRYLRILKYLVLVWSVGGAAVFGVMVFRGYDPWATLINITELSLGPGLAVLLVVIIAAVFVERPWCRYACPLGAISGLLARLGPVHLKREASLCKGCAVCTMACPMGIPVHTANTVRNADCIGCLECTTACPHPGALELKVGLPMIGTRRSDGK